MSLCSDTIYAECREIWRQLLDSRNDKIINEIFSLRRITSPQSCSLFNSFILLKLKKNISVEDILLLIASTKYLVEYSLNPSKNIQIILENLTLFDKNVDLLNLGMFIFAEILQKISAIYVPQLVNLLQVIIIDKKYYHPVIIKMIFDGLIQVIAFPSFALNDVKHVEKLINYIRSINDLEEFPKRQKFIHYNPDIAIAYDLCNFLSTKNFSFKAFSTEYERMFWKRNQLVLRGFIHSNILNYDQWEIVLNNLIEISKTDDELKNSLVMPLLFKMTESSNPKVKISILQNLSKLGASTEVFSTIKALSQGMLRSMAIDLHLRLWKIEPRTYPFLYKVLNEKSLRDDEDLHLNIIRASAVKEICDLKPHHGSDLVTIISDILNESLESKDHEIPASLAIDAIFILCQNHIINITSTWKAINLTTRYEKRPRVIKSLCNFFALVPKFKRNNSEYELLMKDIISRVFHMIQWSDTHGIHCAFEALKSWSYDQLTLDMIPDNFREGIALPDAPAGMEVSILDLEVPGECYVQILSKVNSSALRSAGDLISHFMAQEISEYRSGHYIVKEGQPEPTYYKNLPKQSIVKAISQLVIQQATTRKQEKIVGDEILIEALRVLSQKYTRPLPPLNWTFLQELVHRGDKIKALCMAIAAKQAVISGTAKRLIENILTNLIAIQDIEASLDILADLCNGISNGVLNSFFEQATKNSNINEKLQKCLKNEKNISNRENLAMIISIYIKSSGNVSKDTIKLIPSNIMPLIALNQIQKIEFRCEILKENSNTENAVGWINELISDEYLKNENREFFIKSFVDLLTDKKQSFPKKKWLNEFMAMTENKMIEKGDLDFLLDIFCTAIICFSGYFEIFTKDEIFKNRFIMLPQSIELISSHATHNDIIGSIFDFIYFVVDHKSSEPYQEAFKKSIIAARNHAHFKKPKTWHKILQALVIPKI